MRFLFMRFSKRVRSTLRCPHGTQSTYAGMNSASYQPAGERRYRNGAASTTSTTRLTEWGMSAPHMAEITCLVGGETTPHPDMEEIVGSASATRDTFNLLFCSGCLQTWIPAMLSDLKERGKNGYIREPRSVSMTTRLGKEK